MHGHEVYAHEMHIREIHAFETHAYEIDALGTHSRMVWGIPPGLPPYKRWCGGRFVEIWVPNYEFRSLSASAVDG